MSTTAKPYARLYVDRLEPAVAAISELTGEPVTNQFEFDGLQLAVVGSVLVVAGRQHDLDRYRHVQATLLVSDLGETQRILRRHHATILDGPNDVPTGRNLTARHADGAVVEYVELPVGRLVSAPENASVPLRYLPAVIPHLMVGGAAQAIASYVEVFGAEELFRIAHPDGRIVHAEISVYGSVLMIGDAEPPFAAPVRGPTVGLHVYVDDVDAIAARAAAAGYEILQEPADQFYGDRTVMLRDPFGQVRVLAPF